ncbi:unnamed protein product [Blepharisma stoltei]|uniref:Uncharacterized protein n=1 Tax=Blepharisma stoltei TaxID=1481888 RepID=A0AAU9J841_9CILI|nr:unnamed protein product [Blepharisma stoltei]
MQCFYLNTTLKLNMQAHTSLLKLYLMTAIKFILLIVVKAYHLISSHLFSFLLCLWPIKFACLLKEDVQ